MTMASKIFVCSAFLLVLSIFGGVHGLRNKDLAADVETAHTDLLVLSATSSDCFFRTNDIKALINGDIATNVSTIAGLFTSEGVDAAIIDKFNADMAQTSVSANDLLQLEMNTFRGYEERLHTYAENLLVDLTLIPENVVTLKKDTSTTMSIYLAVDNNLTTYINFLTAEVNAIVESINGPGGAEILSILTSIQNNFAQVRLDHSVAKGDFDIKAPIAENSLQIVADQV